jgi:hypothetical protein
MSKNKNFDLTSTDKSFANWVENNSGKITDLYDNGKNPEFKNQLILMIKQIRNENYSVSEQYIEKFISEIEKLDPEKALLRTYNAMFSGMGLETN